MATTEATGAAWTAWRIDRRRHGAGCLLRIGETVVGEIWRYAPDAPFAWAVEPAAGAVVGGETRTLRGAKAAALAALGERRGA